MTTETKKIDSLVLTIRAEYREAIKGPMAYLDHALKCGEALHAAKKEIGKGKFPVFLKEQMKELRLENDRTLRNWMRWAEPEARSRIEENRKHVSKNPDEGLTVREINEIVKAPLSEARKASIERKKMERAAMKPQSFEERMMGLEIPDLIKLLEDFHGVDFLAALGEEIRNRQRADDPGDNPPVPDRRPPPQQEVVTRL
jgi:hypothetical protein